MFSERLHWRQRPNLLSTVLSLQRAEGAEILDLTESNPTRAGFHYPEDAILGSLADERSLLYEPSARGLPEAREAVSSYYEARGLRIPPERILLTASTSEAYSYLFKLLADPGDEVLVSRPSYPLFEYLASLESVAVRHYPLVYHEGWFLDFDALSLAVSGRTRAIVLVNPNNPTGSFLKLEERDRLLELCAARKIALISDEVFADYGFLPDPNRAPALATSERALTFSLSGLSKVSGLPQLKLGWIAAGGEETEREQALDALELIADTFLSVGAPVQNAAARLLQAGEAVQEQIRQRTAVNLEHLRRQVRPETGCRVLEVEGGWYATLQVPRTRGEESLVLELIERDSVLVQPGFFFDFEAEAFLVLSLLTPQEVFEEGVRRLLARVSA